jgi:hypothetical protein
LTKAHGPPDCAGPCASGSSAPRVSPFGAWLAPGIELTLVGDANDYVGKGLSGGVLAVRPPEARGSSPRRT